MAHHHHTAGAAHQGRLAIVLSISTMTLAVQLTGGLLTGSLALLADAGHLLTDVAGIGLSLLAVSLARRPATPRRTFGYQRVEILATVVNAVLLFGVGGVILYQAIGRLVEPRPVASGGMLVSALIALAANTVSARLLVKGQSESLPVRGAYLEVLADLVAAAAVVVASVVIRLTGFTRADAIASIAIATLIAPRTWKLLREAIAVLVESTPGDVDLAEVRQHILDVPGVMDVHDLHAWTITSGVPVLSAHVVVDNATAVADGCGGHILDQLAACLGGHFDVEHCTFQLEPAGHADHEHPTHP